MYFMENKRPREYEQFMQRTPRFRPRGCGVIAIRLTDSKPPPASYEERLRQTAAYIPCRPCRMRLNIYLKRTSSGSL